ncbi:MAG: hypothetical protein QXY49_06605 [Thermofilaceae archaeon]
MSLLKKISEKVTPPKVSVSLTLKKPYFLLGENVEGFLEVSSQEDFDCSEIRCELECVERVRRMKKVYSESLKREVEQPVWESMVLFSAKPRLAGAMHIPEGFAQRYPFQITIPPTAHTSFKSLDRVVVWNIRGVVAVEKRPDATSKTVELQVAAPSQVQTQQTPQMVTCKYCGTVYPKSEVKCPNCGAPQRE